MSTVKVLGVLVIVLGMGCGRVAPGTSTNARPSYYGSGGGGGGGGGGSTTPASGDSGKPGGVACNPQEKSKYGSMCR